MKTFTKSFLFLIFASTITLAGEGDGSSTQPESGQSPAVQGDGSSTINLVDPNCQVLLLYFVPILFSHRLNVSKS